MQEKIPNITCKEGLPSSEDLQELTSEGRHSCLILDDLTTQIASNTQAEQLWTVPFAPTEYEHTLPSAQFISKIPICQNDKFEYEIFYFV